MPRYLFHVCNGNGFTEDEEGQEWANLDEAHKQALKEARSIMADEMRAGELNLASFIEIEEEGGAAVLTVAFTEAIAINHDRPAEQPSKPTQHQG